MDKVYVLVLGMCLRYLITYLFPYDIANPVSGTTHNDDNCVK